MSDLKFCTLGEWRVKFESPLSILACDERQTIVCQIPAPLSNDRALSDAHLIAAAKKLYRALERIVVDNEVAGAIFIEAREAALAALAEARGERKG